MVENEVNVDLGNGDRETRIKRTLVTQQTAEVLSTLGDGSLGKHCFARRNLLSFVYLENIPIILILISNRRQTETGFRRKE